MMWFLLISFCFNAEEIKIQEFFFSTKKLECKLVVNFLAKKSL